MQVTPSRKRRTRRPSLVKLLKEHGAAALSAFCQQHDSQARLAFAQEAQTWVELGQNCEDELDAIQHYLQALSIDPLAGAALIGVATLGNYSDEEAISLLDLAIGAAKLCSPDTGMEAVALQHKATRLANLGQSNESGMILESLAKTPTFSSKESVKTESVDTISSQAVDTGEVLQPLSNVAVLSAALNPELTADVLAQYQAIEAQLAQYHLSDAGVLTVSGLDGFFAALVSSPNLLSGDQWMPLVFGDGSNAPNWSSTEEFMAFFDQMVVILNRVADVYQENPAAYRPLWLNDASYTNAKAQAVYDWCRSYLKVASLWNMDGDNQAVFSALASIKHHADHRNLPMLGELDGKAQAQIERDILAASLLIYTEFETPRNIELAEFDKGQQKQPIRKEVTTKRNDPCPCGSGKKYKKCCLS